jgi:prepilin-type N-terminal cleavage/methylation domain-containing protein
VKTGGFTLIEVLVVLVILGVMAGVTVPALAGLPEKKEPAEELASELRSLLRGGKRLAIERGVAVVVSLDPETGRYRIAPVVSGSTKAASANPAMDGFLEIPSGVRFLSTSGPQRFRFDRLGSASGPVITIRADTGFQVRISVSPWTGGITVDSSR